MRAIQSPNVHATYSIETTQWEKKKKQINHIQKPNVTKTLICCDECLLCEIWGRLGQNVGCMFTTPTKGEGQNVDDQCRAWGQLSYQISNLSQISNLFGELRLVWKLMTNIQGTCFCVLSLIGGLKPRVGHLACFYVCTCVQRVIDGGQFDAWYNLLDPFKCDFLLFCCILPQYS